MTPQGHCNFVLMLYWLKIFVLSLLCFMQHYVMVVKEFAKLRALRALVPCVLRALHALVPHVSYVPGALRALVPHVPRAIRALMPYVPRSICALVPYVLSCLTYSRALRLSCIVPYVFLCLTCLTCSCTSRAFRFACSRAARDSGSTGPCAPELELFYCTIVSILFYLNTLLAKEVYIGYPAKSTTELFVIN